MTDVPLRIQRRRVKGYRIPADTKSVTRPGLFGNPFPVDVYGAAAAVDLCSRWLTGNMSSLELSGLSRCDRWGGGPHDSVSLVSVRRWILDDLPQLRGKNLACFCRLCDKHSDGKPLNIRCTECAPCHVDVLGELANGFVCTAADHGA
jgi:hypothetical protein